MGDTASIPGCSPFREIPGGLLSRIPDHPKGIPQPARYIKEIKKSLFQGFFDSRWTLIYNEKQPDMMEKYELETREIIREPGNAEIRITLGLGLSVLSPYYRSFVNTLGLNGHERVLDFGSGSGACSRHIAWQLARRSGRLDCVDISQKWIDTNQRILKRFKNVNYFCGRISELALTDESYDLIVAHYVLYEIASAELQNTMKTLCKLLKPRGMMIIREPSGKGLEMGYLEKIIRAAGFRVVTLKEARVLVGRVIEGRFKLNFCNRKDSDKS